jgi:hypothetical protein
VEGSSSAVWCQNPAVRLVDQDETSGGLGCVFLASDADGLSYFFAQLPHPDDGWTVVATCRGTRLTAMNMCVFDTTLDGRLHGPIGAVTTRARWAHPITRREADYSA